MYLSLRYELEMSMKFSMFSDWISQYYGLSKIPVPLTWLDQRRLQTHQYWVNCITFHN